MRVVHWLNDSIILTSFWMFKLDHFNVEYDLIFSFGLIRI